MTLVQQRPTRCGMKNTLECQSTPFRCYNITFERCNKLSNKHYMVEFRLSDLNRAEGWLDNRKCWIIMKTNEKDEGKYQLDL
jgi:hypothetical protein